MHAVREALALLGIERLVFGIHDACIPPSPGDDVGHGAPSSAAGLDLAAFVAELGFTGIQFGPQGEVSASNPSPYDGTVFARSTAAIDLRVLVDDPRWEGLLPRALLDELVEAAPRGRADAASALSAVGRALDAAYARLVERRGRGAATGIEQALSTFVAEQAAWLPAQALWQVLVQEHGGRDFEEWPEHDVDRRLLWPRAAEREAARIRRAVLEHVSARAIERTAFAQMVAHVAHARLRERCHTLGLSIYGDLQIGWSRADLWAHQGLFLRGYRMGAPPSRTNPAGQPWGYPVLDPARCERDDSGAPGPALAVLAARVGKLLSEFDGLRIDHPHGLVCPWVYRSGEDDPLRSVQHGARLHEAPDLADHPRLAAFAFVRSDQIDRTRRRWDDDWILGLEPAQIDRYARVLDRIVEAVVAAGRAPGDVVCEVLSTMPRPLGAVLARHRLGRFRVTQKVGLADPRDVYRSENAEAPDWIMVGNHDTPPIQGVAQEWTERGLAAAHAGYLAERLISDPSERARFASAIERDPRALAAAKLAELFASPAHNVYVWWGDLFGETESYNVPGTIDPANWTLRLPADFRALYLRRLAEGRALDLRAALATALRARGLDRARPDLLRALV
jgi:4-alpha-glucanotransferase